MLISPSDLQEKIDSQIATLYMVFAADLVIVSKTLPIVTEIKTDVFEIVYEIDKKRECTVCEEPEVIAKEVLASELPYWAYNVYKFVTVQGAQFLVKQINPLENLSYCGYTPSREDLQKKYSSGFVFIPSTWGKDFIEEFLDVKATTEFELEYY